MVRLVRQLCPGCQVGSEGQKAIHPFTRSLQECLPQLLLLRCGIHPGNLEPIAAAWAGVKGVVTLDTPGPKEQLTSPRLCTDTPSSQWTPTLTKGQINAQGHTLNPCLLALAHPRALPYSPVPRLRRVPPSWRLAKAPCSQREISAQAWRRSAGPKPS